MEVEKAKQINPGLGPVYIIVAGICWGLIGLFTRRLGALGLSSMQITFLRNMLAMIEMGIVILLRNPKLFRFALKDVWMFLGTGILSIAFFNVCYFKALEMTTMAVASILLYTAPGMVVVMSWLFFREKMTVRKIMALFLAFGGCIFTSGLIADLGNGHVEGLAILVGIGSGFGYALYSIFGSVALKKYDTMTITFYTFLFAMLGMCIPADVPQMVKLGMASPNLLLWGILLSTISTVVPFLCYTTGLKTVVAGKASIMAFIEPMVATLVGILVFHETMTFSVALGIGLIFCSVILLNKSK